MQNRVLLLRHSSGVGIDIALAALPFKESAVGRSVIIEVEPSCFVRLCTAEDLIVMKAFADRVIDWHDVRGIIVRQGLGNLDKRGGVLQKYPQSFLRVSFENGSGIRVANQP